MKRCFNTSAGPKAVGPYSSAVIDGSTVYLSGMVPIDPATGQLVEGGAEAQAARALDNVALVLGELGLTMGHAIKVMVFLTDMADFGAVNRIYGERFGPNYPARSCVEVSKLPLGALVEIEVIATTEA